MSTIVRYYPWKRMIPLGVGLLLAFGGLLSTTLPAATAPPNPAGDLDQCRNGGVGETPENCEDVAGPLGWTNGNAGAENAHFAEGQSIPYRIQLTNLSATTYTLELGYDTKHSSKHAIDYLTTVNRINEVVDPCEDISGLPLTDCEIPTSGPLPPGVTSFAIPSPTVCALPITDLGYTSVPNGDVSQPCTSFANLPADEKRFVMVGGTITSFTYTQEEPLNAAQSETRIVVGFTPTSSVAMIAWGGHIGSRNDWGFIGTVPQSAGGVSGSPYHMRFHELCDTDPQGTGCQGGNQDRSLSAAAVVVEPPALSVTKTPDGGVINAGETASFTIMVSNAGPGTAFDVTLDDVLPDGGLAWSENPDTAECTVTDDPGGDILHCDIGDLASGGSFSVTVETPTDQDDCKLLENLATADASNSDPVSDAGDITVNCPAVVLGKTPGFWGNKNGHAILDPGNDGTLDVPVQIGSGARAVNVTTIAQSDKILRNDSCSTGAPPIITCTGLAPDGLSPGLKRNTLEVLMAQTLALTYNIGQITGYSGQSIATLGCSAELTSPLTGLGLVPGSTVNEVLVKADELIGNSIAGGSTTQAQAGAMNSLLGCLNREVF